MLDQKEIDEINLQVKKLNERVNKFDKYLNESNKEIQRYLIKKTTIDIIFVVIVSALSGMGIYYLISNIGS